MKRKSGHFKFHFTADGDVIGEYETDGKSKREAKEQVTNSLKKKYKRPRIKDE